jgi:hypothetical protein
METYPKYFLLIQDMNVQRYNPFRLDSEIKMLIRQSSEERALFFQLLYAEFVTSAKKESTGIPILYLQCCGSALVLLRIRIQFFYLNADPDPGSQDPDPDQTFESQKVECLHEKYI